LLELIVPVVVEDEEYLIDKLLRGLQDLCLQLPAPSREGSYAAYHAAHRETDRLGVDMLGDVPAYAERLLKSPNGSRFILFFDFLDRIAQLLAQEGLPDRRAAAGAIRDWCDGWAVESGAGSPVPGLTLQRLRQRRAETGENYLPIRRHILVRKAPTTQVVEAWQYWEYAALEQPVGDGPQHARPLPLSDAVDSTERAVVEILSGRLLSLVVAGPDDGPIVEVMLPPGALPTARVDQWEADGQRIGELLPVVVRPVRPRGTGIAPAAFDRWARMWHGPGSGEYVVSTPADRRYLNAPVGCLALDFCPTEQDVVAHLKDAQQVGIPAVLWGCNGASIASLVQGQHVRKLPDRVHRARRDNLPTGDVVLVWDNPYWVPNGAGELVWSDRCDGDGADDE
jgi:hypothetical protein